MQTIPQYAAWCIPLVLMTIDDGYSSQYQAVQYAISKGVMVTSYIVSDRIGEADRLTEAQLIELDAAGCDIGNHTKEHLRFTDQLVTQENIEAAIAGCRDYLEGIGLTRASRHLTPPWGIYLGNDNGATSFAAMEATGMLTSRTGRDELFDVYDYFPDDPYQFPTYVINAAISLETAKGWIDDAIANQKVIVITGHKFTAGELVDINDWAYADWEALIDYIVATRIPALTITQLYALGLGSVEYTPTG